MISGFNTDIECDGTVYHVQTEDKGAPANMIMSLVFDKGTILASKRAKYDDLDASATNEKEIAGRLSRQHQLICAAVKAGRIRELVDMTRKASISAAAAKPSVEAVSVPETVSINVVAPVQSIDIRPQARPEMPVDARSATSISFVDRPTGEAHSPVTLDDISFEDLPVLDARIIEEVEILPAEAVEVISELSGKERPTNTKLSLEILGDSTFKGGERKTVNVMLCRGTDRKVVGDAQIMIKVLGSAFRPVIFHAKSDKNGLARIHLQLPHFQAGRAALLIRAITGGEEIELRKIVTPG